MFYFLLAIHITLCVVLIGLVILQQGKGADMGAAFGGGSNTLFGAGGAADFMTRLTTGLAIAFMVSSVILVKMYQDRGQIVSSGGDSDPLRGSVFEGAQAPKPIEKVDSVPAAGASDTGAVKKDDPAVDVKPSGEAAPPAPPPLEAKPADDAKKKK